MTEQANNDSGKSLSRRSVEGTALLIATRFLVRLIGFVSVSITARILTPEDFGLVGAASIVIALFAVLNQIGLGEYIIRTKKIDEQELQTIWTLRLLISALIAAAIFAAAPLAAEFLQEERLVEVLRVLCVASVLGALRSPASEYFNRNLEYGKDLYLKAADKIVAVVVTVGCALMFRTYWALVWGQLAGMVFAIGSSQVARPFRPRLTLVRSKSVRSFAFWTFLVGLMGYGVRHVDEWIAKRASDTSLFGAYHVARDLCRLFVSEILAPAGQVFFPGAARVQDDPEKLKEVVRRFAGAALVAACAVTTGISAVASELVYLLLGYQWGQAIPFIPYIAFGTGAIIIADLFAGLYVIKNEQHISTRFRFFRLVAIISACTYAAGAFDGLLPVAQAFALVTIATVLIELLWLFSGQRYGVSLLREIWRPGLAAGLMFFVVSSIALPATWPLVVIAALKVAVGATTYIAALTLLWWFAGRPAGGETEFIDRLRDYL